MKDCASETVRYYDRFSCDNYDHGQLLEELGRLLMELKESINVCVTSGFDTMAINQMVSSSRSSKRNNPLQ